MGCCYSHPKKSESKPYYYYKSADDLAEFTHPGCPQCAKVLLTINFKHQGKTYTIATTHFTWALPQDADKVQKRELNKLLQILESLNHFILAGDLNSPQTTNTFKNLNQKYTYHIPSNIKTSIDQKLHRKQGLQLVVDHLFTKGEYSLENIKLKSGLSDHKAIIAKLSR